jgi:hypothetical protein
VTLASEAAATRHGAKSSPTATAISADNAPKATEKATEKKVAKENLQVYRTRFGNDVPLPIDADLRRDRPLGNFPVWQAWGRGCGRAQDPGGLAMD